MFFWLALALTLFSQPVQAKSPPPAPAALDAQLKGALECEQLARLDIGPIAGEPLSITRAKVVPASASFKEFCEVEGVIAPQIGFTLRLPTQSWNGRYYQAGCGGLCGAVQIERCGEAQTRDFAVAAQNMGHIGHYWTNAFWAEVPELRADYGKRSTHLVAMASKAIIAAYYGHAPGKSYFQGCSTGGREGLSSAYNYPGDFDGIVAGDMAFPVRQGAIQNNWNAWHMLDADDREIFTKAKLELLHRAVMGECDGQDGLEDGIISDPRRCVFDPRSLECPPGADAGDCLTRAQVLAAIAVYDGPRNSAGQRLSPGGAPYGSELFWNGRSNLDVTEVSLRHLVFPEARRNIHYRDFDWDKDIAAVEPQAALLDAVPPRAEPDLSAFEGKGGKMIAYHGWADGIPPGGLLDLYERVWRRQGGLDATRGWFRVFMVPGMGHCRGGDAPNTFDFLSAIVAWVEKGTAPDGVIATQLNGDGSIKRTRPLYAYPSVAEYVGTGDANEAANWRPAAPQSEPEDLIDWIWAPSR